MQKQTWWLSGLLTVVFLGTVWADMAVSALTGPDKSGSVAIPHSFKSPPCDPLASRAILGTNGDDVLIGTPGDDVIIGLGGDDVIIGLDGNDTICGGPGDDTLEGDVGDDRLIGNAGNDRLEGNVGNDQLYGGGGDDWLVGGVGNDWLYGGRGDDWLVGNTGNDILMGADGNDFLCGGAGSDTVNGGRGNNSFVDAESHNALILAASVSLVEQIKRLAKKSKMAIIGYTIYNNWQTKKRYHSGDIQTSSGAIQTRMTLSENIAYVNCVFADYLKYSGISRDTLGEKKILQIGPGDNFAVALKLLAMGARQVVCVDRFFPKQNAEQQYQLYQAVREELSEEERRTFDTVVNLNGKIEVNTQKLLPIHGMAIEAAESRLEPESFDLILSRSVLEHLYDPDQAFSVMDRLLAPGGRMVHKIDFRDHGMFTDSGFHPLTFLTIPESVYRLMTLDSGRPNRRLFNYYRDKMTALHYDAQIFITHVVGSDGDLVPSKERAVFGVDYSDATVALLDKIRPKLRAQFRKMSNEELMVSGIFLIARKSSVATRNSEKLVL